MSSFVTKIEMSSPVTLLCVSRAFIAQHSDRLFRAKRGYNRILFSGVSGGGGGGGGVLRVLEHPPKPSEAYN